MRSSIFLCGLLVGLGACGRASTMGDDDGGPDDRPRTCLSPSGEPAGQLFDDTLGTANVAVPDVSACARTYELTSTASRRDNFPAGGRIVTEQTGWPTLRTGHLLFDALHALALDEVRENSVEAIHDGAFANGAPLPCPAGGCFQTGRLWTYVWTRDLSYAVDLGLGGLDPQRALNSLEFKLSAPRAGGAEQIVQDTGTGGSYPVSSDRVTWSLGAAALLPHLDGASRSAFEARASAALQATIEHDRDVVFDAVDGLYLGEQSFLDWREQSYPAWTATDVTPIASSKALSTNVVHLRALELTAQLTTDAGAATRYRGWADALRARIRERFWIEDAGMFATFSTTPLDPAPARQFDLLGSSLAILAGVATPAQADRILSSYPHIGPGAAPVIFPQQQLTRIYHNRAEWPFVTAYLLRAAAEADHPAAADRALRSLMRAAALNLSNMENLEISSGAPWVDDGAFSGPVVNSHRQLWSVGGYISMVHHTLFGLRFTDDGLHVRPYLTRDLRSSLFAGTDSLALNDVPWRGATISVVLHLPAVGGEGGSYEIGAIELNGVAVDGPIGADRLEAMNRIDVTLVAPIEPSLLTVTHRNAANWREIFAPRPPVITAVRRAGAAVAIDLDAGGEDTSMIEYAVYRDGVRIASDLSGPGTSFTDVSASANEAPCYAVETCFTTTGNCSQRSRPMCWWGDGAARVQSYPASTFAASGGVASSDHGRFHYGSWGDLDDTLTITTVAPARTGPYLVQLVYGNGAGPIDTGITCGIKRIVIEEIATNQPVASGVVVMPQLGTWSRWADSTFMRADLDASKTYRITIRSDERTANMSGFSHFATYGGAGGASGRLDDVNIAELKLLAR